MKSCKNFTKNLIKYCDLFGTTITFKIYDENEYKSLLGGISTIIYTIIALSYIIYNFSNFILRKNIDFIYSNKILESGPIINLTNSKFYFAFGLQFSKNASSDVIGVEKYFNYDINGIEWIDENDFFYTNYYFKKCEYINDFNDIKKEIFELNQLDEMFCVSNLSNLNLTLEGLYTDYYFKFLQIDVYLSNYSYNNLNEVKKFMNDNPLEMAIYFLDTAVDYKSQKNFLQSYVNYIYKSIDVDFIKKTDIFISSVVFENDENWLFSNPKITYDSMYDYSVDSIKYLSSRENNEKLLGRFIIKASPKIVQLVRKYQKLPTFIADVSAILEELLVIMILFTTMVERKAIDFKLIHRVLKFKGSKYYDIDYLLNMFQLDKKNSKIINLIKTRNLDLKKSDLNVTNLKIMLNKSVLSNQLKNINDNNIKLPKKSFSFTMDNLRPKLDNGINEIENTSNQKNNLLEEKKNIELNLDNADEISKKILKLYKNNSILNINKISPSRIYKKSILKNKVNPFINNYVEKNVQNQTEITKKSELELAKKKNYLLEQDSFDSLNPFPQLNNFLIKKLRTKKTGVKKKRNTISSTLRNITTMNTFKKDRFLKPKLNSAEIHKDFANLNIFQIFFSSLFFCVSKKNYRRYQIFKNEEKKIHYYLDIFTYVKKMQEIDLLKYCLFDEEQLNLFEFLSKPPYKFTEIDNYNIYKEFEDKQTKLGVLGKHEINNLFNSYKKIRDKKNLTFEDLKLLRLVKADVEFLE